MSKPQAFRDQLYGSPATVRTKLSLFNNHIAPFCRSDDITQLIYSCMTHWEPLSPSTVKTLFVLLREYIAFTYEEGLDIKRLKHVFFNRQMEELPKVKVWTSSEVQTALGWAENDQELWDYMTVALETGMRRGEIFALMPKNVDFLKDRITVKHSMDFDSREIGPTKNRKARSIQMSEKVAKILYRRYTPGKEDVPFFEPRDYNPRLKRLARETGVPEISVHDLRHTFATTCIEKEISLKWVSATLGHSKVSTTMDIYWQVLHKAQDIEGLYDE